MRIALVAAALALVAAPLEAQYLTVEVENKDSIHVGDVVTLAVEAHLGPQETMASYVPALAGELPEGVRLLSADTLTRDANRVFVGKVRFAFYRPGIQDIPLLQVVVRHTPTDRGTPYQFNQPTVEVTTLAPEGNPPLKDIRDPIAPRGPSPVAVLGALLFAGLGLFGWRRLRRRPKVVAAAPAPVLSPVDARTAALRDLDAISGEGWTSRDPVRAIELAAGVLRGYVLGRLPRAAGALTTHELVALLPTSLNGTAGTVGHVLTGADLVKFARVRPDTPTAEAYVGEVRRALEAMAGGTDA
jgi:hypothetical protein